MAKKAGSTRFKSVGAFSGGQLPPIRYFKAKPFAIGYNGRSDLNGENWLTDWALPALKKAAPVLKKHGFATAVNTVKNLRKNQGLFNSVKNALGTQVKTAFGGVKKKKKPIKGPNKGMQAIIRRRNAKAKQPRAKRKPKKKKYKGGFKELVL